MNEQQIDRIVFFEETTMEEANHLRLITGADEVCEHCGGKAKYFFLCAVTANERLYVIAIPVCEKHSEETPSLFAKNTELATNETKKILLCETETIGNA